MQLKMITLHKFCGVPTKELRLKQILRQTFMQSIIFFLRMEDPYLKTYACEETKMSFKQQ
jgi:hypothetical protein